MLYVLHIIVNLYICSVIDNNSLLTTTQESQPVSKFYRPAQGGLSPARRLANKAADRPKVCLLPWRRN